MAKKRALLISLISLLFIISIASGLQPPLNRNHSPLHNESPLTKQENNIISNWTLTGDFAAWYWDGMAPIGCWSNTTDTLIHRHDYAHVDTAYFFRYLPTNVSTAEFHYIYFDWSLNITNTTDPTDYVIALIELNYNDSTCDVYSSGARYAEVDGEAYYDLATNITLDAGKFVEYWRFYITAYGCVPYLTLETRLYEELILGVAPPAPTNISLSDTSLRVTDLSTVSCALNLTFSTFFNCTYFVVLNLVYIDTNQGTTWNMTCDWTLPTYYYITLTFNRSGDYRFFITMYLSSTDWGIRQLPADSGLYGFIVHTEDEIIYPASSYLTIWTPLGIAIPTNMKVFLGESETHELFYPAIGANLSWRAYANNSYDHPITYSYSNNKIYWSAISNGIEANVPNISGSYPNIETYESLVFSIKVTEFRASTQLLIIGLNSLSADYYLSLTDAYLNKWVQFIIPFCQFTWRYYQAALAEIQFLGGLTCYLKNIYIADYKNLSTILSNGVNYTTDINASSTEYNTAPLPFSFENQTATQSGYINNSGYINKTYDLISANSTTLETPSTNIAETGHYLTTSFANDTDGANPADPNWEISEPTSTDISVQSNYYGHNKVLYLNDDSSTSYPSAYYNLSTSEIPYGAVEWWFRCPTADEATHFVLYNGGASPICALAGSYSYLSIPTYDFHFFNSSGHYYFMDYASDTWYHLRLTWDSTEGEYDGNSQYHWSLYVNGSCLIDNTTMQNNVAGAKRWRFHDYDSPRDTNDIIVDGLDCSSFTGYYPNRSLKQALQSNNTGTYIGTYSFTDDTVGADPTGWTVSESANTEVEVLGTFDGHNKVLDLNDSSATGLWLLYNNFTDATTGSVELWFQFDTNNRQIYFLFYDDSNNPIHLYIHLTDTCLKYYYAGDNTICQVYNSIWYHLKIDWIETGFQITLNDILYGSGYAFLFYQPMVNGINQFLMKSRNADTGYHVYVDAIDYSWSPNYYANRCTYAYQTLNTTQAPALTNIPEGLLLGVSIDANITYSHGSAYTIGYYNFTAAAYDYFEKTSATFSELIAADYFNTTHVLIRLNYTADSNTPASFTLQSNVTATLNYSCYVNTSYLYYYDLTVADLYYYYNLTLNETEEVGTTASFYWRYSNDNSSWSAWSDSTSIYAYGAHYLNYRIDCNVTYAYNTSHFYEADLYLDYANNTYYINYNITRAFSYSATVFKSLYLLNSISLNISTSPVLNSSLQLYNFGGGTFWNFSSVNNASINQSVTSIYWNSTYHVIENFLIWAQDPFTLNFTSATLQLMNWSYSKYCYIDVNITGYNSSFDIFVIHFEFNSSYSTSTINFEWQFTNDTYYRAATYPQTSTYPYCPRAEVFYLYTDYGITAADLKGFRFTFIADSGGVNVSELANVTKIFLVGNKTYRLYSDVNRQPSTVITFDSANETLLLTDYYGNFVFKEEFNRTLEGDFIDAMINFWEVTFSNLVKDTTVTFYIENRNLNITVTLTYGQSVTLGLFTDDYVIVLWDDSSLQVIDRWDITISRTQYRSFSHSIPIPVDPDDGGTVLLEQILSNEYFPYIILFICIIGGTYAINRRQISNLQNSLQTRGRGSRKAPPPRQKSDKHKNHRAKDKNKVSLYMPP